MYKNLPVFLPVLYVVPCKVVGGSNIWTSCTVLCFSPNEGYYYNIHKSRGYENEITTQWKEHGFFFSSKTLPTQNTIARICSVGILRRIYICLNYPKLRPSSVYYYSSLQI